MIKKLILLILFTSFSAFTHSVKDGDMDGSWQIVEAFINGCLLYTSDAADD